MSGGIRMFIKPNKRQAELHDMASQLVYPFLVPELGNEDNDWSMYQTMRTVWNRHCAAANTIKAISPETEKQADRMLNCSLPYVTTIVAPPDKKAFRQVWVCENWKICPLCYARQLGKVYVRLRDSGLPRLAMVADHIVQKQTPEGWLGDKWKDLRKQMRVKRREFEGTGCAAVRLYWLREDAKWSILVSTIMAVEQTSPKMLNLNKGQESLHRLISGPNNHKNRVAVIRAAFPYLDLLSIDKGRWIQPYLEWTRDLETFSFVGPDPATVEPEEDDELDVSQMIDLGEVSPESQSKQANDI